MAELPEPRSFLVDPEQFGRDERPEWKRLTREQAQADPTLVVGFKAAHYQHQLALYMRRARKSKDLRTWAEVASAVPIGVKAWQLQAIMRGQAHMSLRHMVALESAFGRLFAPASEVEMLKAQKEEAILQRDALERRVRQLESRVRALEGDILGMGGVANP